MNKNISIVIIIVLFVSVLAFQFGDKSFATDFKMKTYDYDVQKNIYIDVGGAEILFSDKSERIEVSQKLKVTMYKDSIYIRSPRKNTIFNFLNDENYKIIIGKKYKFEKVDIDVGGAKIQGLIEADRVYIDGGGMKIYADIKSDRISIDGGGIKIRSEIEAQELSIDGAGMDISLKLKGTEDFSLDGAGIKANVKYLDTWKGQRYLKMNGVGGKLDVYMPGEDIIGELNVDADGIIDVEIHHY